MSNYLIIKYKKSELIFLSIFHLLTKSSPENKHKKGHHGKKHKQVGLAAVCLPIGNDHKNGKDKHGQIGVFKYFVNGFIHHLWFYLLHIAHLHYFARESY